MPARARAAGRSPLWPCAHRDRLAEWFRGHAERPDHAGSPPSPSPRPAASPAPSVAQPPLSVGPPPSRDASSPGRQLEPASLGQQASAAYASRGGARHPHYPTHTRAEPAAVAAAVAARAAARRSSASACLESTRRGFEAPGPGAPDERLMTKTLYGVIILNVSDASHPRS
eukprot:7384053-Prymnesium_polylepis.1